MKISIITAVYNRARTIESAIQSVVNQRDVDIEYIIVDALSNDGTEEIVRKYEGQVARYIREKDKGIYDALNKGLRAATGDVIGFLHADDMLASPECICKVAKAFENPAVDATYADLLYVTFEDPDKIVRYWKSGPFRRNKFRFGWMPPHPTVYLRRRHYEELGGYRDDFQISADYELLVRMMYAGKLNVEYINEILVKMRVGGKSNASLSNRMLANREDRNAWGVNGLKSPFALQFTKPGRKLLQYFLRP